MDNSMNEIDQKTEPGQRCHDPYLRCALYGAAQAVLGIRGCCVLSHAPQGCYQLVNAAFGWQDADYTETFTLSTKLCENEIVNGGEDLLARTILEAREFNIPVMFVLSSCGPEIVGDDIIAVCREMRPKVDFNIVPVRCAGFKGDQNYGTDMALDAILRQLVTEKQERLPKSVCLIAPHANGNPTWMGDLTWVTKILEQMGISHVTNLTSQTRPGELAHIGDYEFSMVLSHDAGQKAADYLSKEFSVKQLCRDLPLPVGFTNTRRWLMELGNGLGTTDIAKKLVDEGEYMVVDQCRRKGLEQFFMHRAPTAIVADATVGIPLLRFISEDLEMIPQLICLKSGLPEAKEIVEREIETLKLSPKLIYDADVYQAKTALAETMPEIVFGSNIERHAVEELDIPFVFRIVNPLSKFRIINREYFGYSGMLNLIESIQNDWLDRYRSRERRYHARW
jgi:nitrogenase molybdenum-iron protein alpha/beta subunit